MPSPMTPADCRAFRESLPAPYNGRESFRLLFGAHYQTVYRWESEHNGAPVPAAVYAFSVLVSEVPPKRLRAALRQIASANREAGQ